MSDPEVVVRLLAAIDEVERLALEAAPHRMQLVWSRRAGNARTKAFLDAVADPESVLRLCQAHRDIVAAWRRAKAELDEGVRPMFRDIALATERALWNVLILLARGYGVEDGED